MCFSATALYVQWGLTAYSFDVYIQNHSLVYVNPATTNAILAVFYVIATCGALSFSEIRSVRCSESDDSPHRYDGEELRVHLRAVRLCCGREYHHPRVFLAERGTGHFGTNSWRAHVHE